MMHFIAASNNSNQHAPSKSILFLIISLCLSTNVSASTFNGFIEKMIVGRDGHEIYVHMKDAPQTCNNDHPLGFNYALSLSEHAASKETFSAMMASQMVGRKITIQGSSSCVVHPHMENISYVYIYDE